MRLRAPRSGIARLMETFLGPLSEPSQRQEIHPFFRRQTLLCGAAAPSPPGLLGAGLCLVGSRNRPRHREPPPAAGEAELCQFQNSFCSEKANHLWRHLKQFAEPRFLCTGAPCWLPLMVLPQLDRLSCSALNLRCSDCLPVKSNHVTKSMEKKAPYSIMSAGGQLYTGDLIRFHFAQYTEVKAR